MKIKKASKNLYFTSLTNTLIIINAAAFIVFLIILGLNENLISSIAVQPSNILSGKALWTILTSMFAHGGFIHLLVNMFSLFFIGNLTEKIIGRKRFFWFYLIAGIAGSLAFVLFAYLGTLINNGILADRIFGSINDLAVGASGALFGLIGILAVLIPYQRVYLILGPLIIIIAQITIAQFLPASILPIFYGLSTILIFITALAMFSPNPKFRKLALPAGMPLWMAPIAAIIPLVIVSFFVKLPIGNTAHFGGLIAGLVYGTYLKNKYRKKVEILRRMFKS